MKLLIAILFVAIVASLIVALTALLRRPDGNSYRCVRALTVRIALSFVVFVVLLTGFFAGWIRPHGLYPGG